MSPGGHEGAPGGPWRRGVLATWDPRRAASWARPGPAVPWWQGTGNDGMAGPGGASVGGWPHRCSLGSHAWLPSSGLDWPGSGGVCANRLAMAAVLEATAAQGHGPVKVTGLTGGDAASATAQPVPKPRGGGSPLHRRAARGWLTRSEAAATPFVTAEDRAWLLVSVVAREGEARSCKWIAAAAWTEHGCWFRRLTPSQTRPGNTASCSPSPPRRVATARPPASRKRPPHPTPAAALAGSHQ